MRVGFFFVHAENLYTTRRILFERYANGNMFRSSGIRRIDFASVSFVPY